MENQRSNKTSYYHFKHSFNEHHLLHFDQLKSLALRHPSIRFNSSKLSRSQNLDTVIKDCPPETSLKDALNNIQTSNSCIVIREIQKDPQYTALINNLLRDIQTDKKIKPSQMRNINAWVFITSPGGVTPYHRDIETTHFFHIEGKKKFYVWDHHDREVVTQEENEFFHGVSNLKETKYKDQIISKAKTYDLTSGDGLYIPATAPHMVENDFDTFTVSFSITYMSDDDYKIRRIHKINQILRKFGFNPKDTNQSTIANFCKLITHAFLRTIFIWNKDWKNS